MRPCWPWRYRCSPLRCGRSPCASSGRGRRSRCCGCALRRNRLQSRHRAQRSGGRASGRRRGAFVRSRSRSATRGLAVARRRHDHGAGHRLVRARASTDRGAAACRAWTTKRRSSRTSSYGTSAPHRDLPNDTLLPFAISSRSPLFARNGARRLRLFAGRTPRTECSRSTSCTSTACSSCWCRHPVRERHGVRGSSAGDRDRRRRQFGGPGQVPRRGEAIE